jgi:hypothetical protein
MSVQSLKNGSKTQILEMIYDFLSTTIHATNIVTNKKYKKNERNKQRQKERDRTVDEMKISSICQHVCE